MYDPKKVVMVNLFIYLVVYLCYVQSQLLFENTHVFLNSYTRKNLRVYMSKRTFVVIVKLIYTVFITFAILHNELNTILDP